MVVIPYTKTVLKRTFKFIPRPAHREVEITFPDWTFPGVTRKLRVCAQNAFTTLGVARPCRMGFNVGYDWMLSRPMQGAGYVTLMAEATRRGHWSLGHPGQDVPTYRKMVVCAIFYARQMLREQGKAEGYL